MELREIDSKNIWKVIELTVKDEQSNFVATNTESILEAYTAITSGIVALPFGIYSENTLVGFIMFGYDTIGDEDQPNIAAGNYCIWRFMIDKAYQKQGFGKKAMQIAIDYLRSEPCGKAQYCWLSYEPDNVGAKVLYHSFGFVENGEMDGEEMVAVLKL